MGSDTVDHLDEAKKIVVPTNIPDPMQYPEEALFWVALAQAHALIANAENNARIADALEAKVSKVEGQRICNESTYHPTELDLFDDRPKFLGKCGLMFPHPNEEHKVGFLTPGLPADSVMCKTNNEFAWPCTLLAGHEPEDHVWRVME